MPICKKCGKKVTLLDANVFGRQSMCYNCQVEEEKIRFPDIASKKLRFLNFIADSFFIGVLMKFEEELIVGRYVEHLVPRLLIYFFTISFSKRFSRKHLENF
ncbi:MAG: hypothetical protein ABIK93_02735 [candidate division WOR-3 bacterium]